MILKRYLTDKMYIKKLWDWVSAVIVLVGTQKNCSTKLTILRTFLMSLNLRIVLSSKSSRIPNIRVSSVSLDIYYSSCFVEYPLYPIAVSLTFEVLFTKILDVSSVYLCK